MERFFYHIGRFVMLLGSMFRAMEKPKVYYKLTLAESVSMIGGSMLILVVISFFVGAVTTVQTAYQLTSNLVSNTIIGAIVSTTAILELSPGIVNLVIAGRIGSKIASEIGTMRVTEQIDALEVMGVNSKAYLILPKIFAGLISLPILTTISAFLAHAGGITAGHFSGEVTYTEFILGMREYYNPYQVVVMYVKAAVFGLIIASVSSYQGYFTRGGALDVGASATRAVVFSCLTITLADYLVAQLML
ncbi:MAG: ABC transporter permease [Bacteroidia bacterium]|nr:ABC transporter permease [Bacteroidia bacterium]